VTKQVTLTFDLLDPKSQAHQGDSISLYIIIVVVVVVIIIIIIKTYYSAPQPVLRSASQHRLKIKYIKM